MRTLRTAGVAAVKARSLSEYVTTGGGRTLIFSFLRNNFTVPNREVERVQDATAAAVR